MGLGRSGGSTGLRWEATATEGGGVGPSRETEPTGRLRPAHPRPCRPPRAAFLSTRSAGLGTAGLSWVRDSNEEASMQVAQSALRVRRGGPCPPVPAGRSAVSGLCGVSSPSASSRYYCCPEGPGNGRTGTGRPAGKAHRIGPRSQGGSRTRAPVTHSLGPFWLKGHLLQEVFPQPHPLH